MTSEEIFEALGVTYGDETMKQRLLDDIESVVELRMLGIYGDLLTDAEVTHLEIMEKRGASKQEMLDWLAAHSADAKQMQEALTRDYVAELAERLVAMQN